MRKLVRAMRIEFLKGETMRYRSVLHRPDGVTLEFEGGSYNRLPERVPHDLAHLIVEDELGLTSGVWGVLAAGGLFGHATVVAGRQAPHAAERGRAIVAAAREQVMQAEVLTRAVCDVVKGDLPRDLPALKRAVGKHWTDELTADALDRCESRLRAGAAGWAALEPGAALAATWPER
jgi:hypothetical protein